MDYHPLPHIPTVDQITWAPSPEFGAVLSLWEDGCTTWDYSHADGKPHTRTHCQHNVSLVGSVTVTAER